MISKSSWLLGAVVAHFLCFAVFAGEGTAVGGNHERQLIQLRDGRAISYREYGSRSGKPVFYFHGMLSSSVEAEYIADEIRDAGIRLIALDRPGIGGSTYYPDRKVFDWVSDVCEAADILGIKKQRFGIITVSGGACYGCACAVKIPHRIDHLAIVSGYSPFDVEGIVPGNMDQSIRLVSSRPILGELLLDIKERQLYRNPGKVTRWVTSQSIPADQKLILDDEKMHQILINNLKEAMCQGPEGIMSDIDLLRNHWGFEVCEIKGVSVSIWSGQSDPIATPSMAQYFNHQINGSHIVLGPNQGHATMIKRYAPPILRQF